MELVVSVIDDSSETVSVVGSLNTNNAFELEALVSNLDRDVRHLTFDLEKCEYVSSAGLRIFLMAYKKMLTVGGVFILANPNDDVLDVLELVGMRDMFSIV